jgi:hopanoid-associated phosphorylase
MIVAVTGLAREARIARGANVRVVTGGASTARLRDKLAAALDSNVRGVISFGICGGLSPDMQPGTCIIASEILWRDGRALTDREWAARLSRRLPNAVTGPVAGVEGLVSSKSAKFSLFVDTHALGADMESHVVAELARDHGIPFASLRAVADPADCGLPPAAACSVIKENGTVEIRSVLASVAAQPGQIPQLIRLAGETRAALRALLRCRDLVGPGLAGPDFR